MAELLGLLVAVLKEKLQLQGARWLGLEHATTTPLHQVPELLLNICMVSEMFLQILATGLGALAFVWATVVLLGGFSTSLQKQDFWVITAIVFIQTARVVGINVRPEAEFFNLVPPAFLELGVEYYTRWGRRRPLTGQATGRNTVNYVMLGLGSERRFLIFLACLSMFVLAVPMIAGLGCISLSIYRLVALSRHHDNSNVFRALILLYALVLLQGGLFIIWLGLRLYRFHLANQVSLKYGLEGKNELIDKYMDKTLSMAIKNGVSSTINRNLASFAADLMKSDYSHDHIDAILMMHTLTSQEDHRTRTSSKEDHRTRTSSKEDHRTRTLFQIQSSPLCVSRLFDMVTTKSRTDQRTKICIAEIVVHLATNLRLADISGATESISSMIDPYFPKVSTPATDTNGAENDGLFISVERIKLFFAGVKKLMLLIWLMDSGREDNTNGQLDTSSSAAENNTNNQQGSASSGNAAENNTNSQQGSASSVSGAGNNTNSQRGTIDIPSDQQGTIQSASPENITNSQRGTLRSPSNTSEADVITNNQQGSASSDNAAENNTNRQHGSASSDSGAGNYTNSQQYIMEITLATDVNIDLQTTIDIPSDQQGTLQSVSPANGAENIRNSQRGTLQSPSNNSEADVITNNQQGSASGDNAAENNTNRQQGSASSDSGAGNTMNSQQYITEITPSTDVNIGLQTTIDIPSDQQGTLQSASPTNGAENITNSQRGTLRFPSNTHVADVITNDQQGTLQSSSTTGGAETKPLIIHGLSILAKLAVNPDNCKQIYDSKGLFSKIISPVKNKWYKIPDDDCITMEITEKALEVVSMLVSRGDEINGKIRQDICSNGIAVNDIRPILQRDKMCNKLKVPTTKILTELYLDISTRATIGLDNIAIFISVLMNIFFDADNENGLRKTAGKALARLAMDNANCTTIMNFTTATENSVVQLLTAMIPRANDKLYQTAIAQLLMQLCANSNSNAERERLESVKIILHEVLKVICNVEQAENANQAGSPQHNPGQQQAPNVQVGSQQHNPGQQQAANANQAGSPQHNPGQQQAASANQAGHPQDNPGQQQAANTNQAGSPQHNPGQPPLLQRALYFLNSFLGARHSQAVNQNALSNNLPAVDPLVGGRRKYLAAFLGLGLQICKKLNISADEFDTALARVPLSMGEFVDKLNDIIEQCKGHSIDSLEGKGPSVDYLVIIKTLTKLCTWMMEKKEDCITEFQNKNTITKLQGALEDMRGLELRMLLTGSAGDTANYETLSSIVATARQVMDGNVQGRSG